MGPARRASAARRSAAAVVVAWLALLGLAVLGAPAAVADERDHLVTRMDVDVALDANGGAVVTTSFDMDFRDDAAHGPYLTYVTREGYTHEHNRIYRPEIQRVWTPADAGTPVDYLYEDADGALTVQIGDEDVEITGSHTYEVTIRWEGLTTGASITEAGDQLLYDVVGSAWELARENVTVVVHGPAPIREAACVAGGAGSQATCDAVDQSADGASAIYRADRLEPGEGLTVLARFDDSALGDPVPLTEPNRAYSRAWHVGGAGIWVGLALALAGVVGVARKATRVGRDERAFTGSVDGKPALRTAPPTGFRPGELGTLVDERVDAQDITATILDLAIRGYLRLEQQPSDDASGFAWHVTRTREPDAQLLAYEALVLETVSTSGQTIPVTDLAKAYATSMPAIREAMYAHVVDRGWFSARPDKVRNRWLGWGTVVLLVGIVATIGLLLAGPNLPGWAWPGVAVCVTGVTILAVSGRAPARTASGSAVTDEVRGFERYLEEGDGSGPVPGDVVERYLPYAFVFKVAEQWAARASGMSTAQWLVHSGAVTSWVHAVTAVTSFGDAAGSALGVSGGAGGGGSVSVGGGTGGGGGGSW